MKQSGEEPNAITYCTIAKGNCCSAWGSRLRRERQLHQALGDPACDLPRDATWAHGRRYLLGARGAEYSRQWIARRSYSLVGPEWGSAMRWRDARAQLRRPCTRSASVRQGPHL